MRFAALFFIALLLPGIFRDARAQTYHFRNLSVDAGLPFVQVHTIYQSSKGYLWTGGYGGLSRYDGRSFENYSPRNGLANHLVNAIAEDGKGRLWVGTIKGVNVFDGKKFELFDHRNALPDDNVNRIIADEYKTIWIGTNKGLVRYDGRDFKVFGKDAGLIHEQVLCLYEDRRSHLIWIGTPRGAYAFNGQRFEYHPVSNVLDNTVSAITQDKDGVILLGTPDGVYKKNERGFTLLLTPSELGTPSVNAMLTDSRGVTWIGAEDGLYSYDGKNFQFFRPARDENGRNVRSLYEDYEGNLWLGTFSGLYRFRGAAFAAFGVHEGLYSTFVYQMIRDRRNQLWVGTTTGGIYVYDGKIFRSYNRSNGMPNNQANCVTETADGDVWVGTNKGLVRFRNDKIIHTYTSADGLGNDTINCFLKDRKGRLWFGGNHLLSVMENGKFRYYKLPPAAQKYGVYALEEDEAGVIWIGTYLGGLYRLIGGVVERMDARLGLRSDSYLALVKDNTGTIYFGSLDGVYVYRSGLVIDRISESDGLSSNLTYSLLLDSLDHHLWIGTNQGVNKFDLGAYRRDGKKHSTHYGKEEGFTGVECNSSGVYRERDGLLWFGTVNGLIRYEASQWHPDTALPRTNITRMRLFYADTVLPDKAELEWDQNHLSFEYIGICLANPAKVQYRHILEGFDAEWSPPSNEYIATYPNLPPGTYTFKVVSSNSEGLWNETPATLRFTIETPFWQQLWFWLVLLGAATVGLFTAIRIRIRNIRTRERREAQVRVEIAMNQLKALRAQMNPHFVFNSLNSIQHFIMNNNSAEAGKYLNKFARLIRIILYNSEKPSVTIREELEALNLYLDLEYLRFEGKFEYRIDVAPDVDMDYFEIPTMLLQPYIENAILHGLMPKPEKGRLDVIIRLSGELLVCSVIDNGIGRRKARELRQLSRKKDHKSMGMRITQDRLEIINRLHGSNLTLSITDLEDEKGNALGTKVEIFVPVL